MYSVRFIVLKEEKMAKDAATQTPSVEFDGLALQGAMLEVMPFGLVITEKATGEILYVNPEFCKIFRYTKEKLMGTNIEKLYYSPSERKLVEKISAQKSIREIVIHGKRGDNSEMWSVVTTNPISYNGKEALLFSVYDITEQQNLRVLIETASQIAAEVSTTVDPDQVLQKAIPLIKERLGLYYVHVYTLDEQEGLLKLRVGYGEPGRVMLERGHSIPYDAEKSLVARAARSKEPVVVNDVRADPNFLPNPLLPDTKAEVAVPMVVEGKVLGVFDVQHDQVDYFTDAYVGMFGTLAGQIATTLHTAQLFDSHKQLETELAQFATQLRTSAEVATRLNTILDPDELFNIAIPLIKEQFGLYHVHFYEFVPQNEMLVLRAGYGRPGQIMKQQGHKIPLGRKRSIVARAARTKAPVVENNVLKSPDYLLNLLLPNTRAELAVPVILGEQLLGVLDVQADRTDFFPEAGVDVYRTLAGQIATSFQNARHFAQQQEAETTLREAIEKINAIFNAITDGIAESNLMGIITEVNATTLSLLGYTSDTELLDSNFIEVIAPDSRTKAAETFVRALQEGRSGTQELEFIRRDGTTFTGELSVTLLRDTSGEPIGFVNAIRDVTERKQAEEQRLASETRYRALFENIRDGVFLVQGEAFSMVNPAMSEITGYTEEELLSMKLGQLIVPEEKERVLKVYHDRLAGRTHISSLETQMLRKDGERIYVVMSSTLLEIEGTMSALGTVKDVTEQKQAMLEQERLAMRLDTSASIAAQINQVLDPEQILEIAINELKERFGLYYVHVYLLDEETQNLVLKAGYGEPGRTMVSQGHHIPLNAEQSLVARAARTLEPIVVQDVTQDPGFLPNPLLPLTKAEAAIPAVYQGRVLAVFDIQHDKPHSFAASDIDVFLALTGQIATALQNARFMEELQQTMQRLRDVDRLKSEFLANMSHELRTPLNSILGYTEVLLMGIDGELTPEMEEDVKAVHENGQQLLTLINDILDLTKIEAGQMTLTLEPVEVPELLNDVRTNNMGLLHRRGKPVTMEVELEDNLPCIIADQVRVAQILNNLVSNAVKFTDEGYIKLRAQREGNFVRIDVEDTGIGISQEDIPQLFERFRQVDGSSTRRAEGTGLGLAITRHLVEMHGGRIEVQSEVGKGSTFSVWIPVCDEAM